MKKRRLTHNQKKCQRALEREIDKVKKDAWEKSHGIQHKYVKIATNELQRLYCTPRFRDNQNFLLRRYIKLEKFDKIWQNLCIPVLISYLFASISFNELRESGLNIITDIGTLIDAIRTLPTLETIMNIKFWVFIVFSSILVIIYIFYTIYMIVSCGKMFADSISRDADSTIKENELIILKALLCEYKIFLREGESLLDDK